MINDISRLKKKNHMTMSIEADKALDKIQHPLLIKTSQQARISEELPHIYKLSQEL